MTTLSVQRQPASVPALIQELTEFCVARLGKPASLDGRKPCLAEDWWVEDRLAEGWRFPKADTSPEEGLRLCWRLARDRRVQGLPGGNPDLILHQMAVLLPALFLAASDAASKGASA